VAGERPVCPHQPARCCRRGDGGGRHCDAGPVCSEELRQRQRVMYEPKSFDDLKVDDRVSLQQDHHRRPTVHSYTRDRRLSPGPCRRGLCRRDALRLSPAPGIMVAAFAQHSHQRAGRTIGVSMRIDSVHRPGVLRRHADLRVVDRRAHDETRTIVWRRARATRMAWRCEGAGEP